MFTSSRRGSRYNRGKLLISIIVLALSLCLFAGNQQAAANGSSSVLVETKWLADNLNNPDMRIVYVGSPSPKSMADFGGKHIPGSVYAGIGSVMKVLGNGSAPPDKMEFEAFMGRLGIGNNTHVVFYGSGGGNPFITTVFWLMKYFGHDKAGYLNGGLAKWDIEKHKTVSGAPAKTAPVKYTAVPDESIRSTADYVLKNRENSNVVIVDVRGLDAFKGIINEVPAANKRTGHIPGAVNLNFYPSNLNQDGTFKSVDDLKAVYEAKGVIKDKEIIVYCQGGVRASHTFFALKYLLGYPNVKNYAGSWGEWANLDPAKYPVEK